ncbi:MAG: LysR family transcriptional regulator [Pseudomonadota bacterium]
MDKLHAMRVFMTVADRSGFASAARDLGMSPAAVTRAVSSLEAHLQARLLTRSTRHVSLTEAGVRYLDDCRRILSDVEEADAHAKGLFSDPRGLLSVTASALFGRLYITPIILEYLDRYPETDVRGVLVDRVVNIIEEGIDVAVRIGALADSSLHAVRVGTVRQVLCASSDYLAKAGTPETPDDLDDHQLISSGVAWSVGGWKFDDSKQAVIKPRLSLGDGAAAISAARAGWGITRVLSYQVAEDLDQGQLVAVLTGEETEEPVHIVHVEGRRAAAKVRAFVDLAVERLRADKRLNP